MQAHFRSFWRFFYFAFSTIFTIMEFNWGVMLGRPKEKIGPALRKKWLTHVPGQMGLDMRVEGTPFHGPCLYVGNHITYIDPLAVLMHVDAYVVAKSEIASWPLIGTGAYIAGTIFVKREEQSSRQEAARAIREALEKGISILVFPEGTTSAGPGTLPFRPRTFEAARLAGVPVQPFALIYDHPEVAYIGDDTFLPHFLRLIKLKTIRGRIAFGPLLHGEDTCEASRQWIEKTQASYAG